MSFSVVWFGVQGKEPAAFLEDAGFVDTGETDEFYDAEVSGAVYPGGWYVMVCDDIEMFDLDDLQDWSAGARLVAVVYDEDTQTSIATEWVNGQALWSISHEPGDGEPVLAVDGEMPEAFKAVRREYLDRLDGSATDKLAFEVPADVAKRITGFRHDSIGFEDNAPVFTRLEAG